MLAPPGPAHVSEYSPLAVNGPVLWLPLAASMPLQSPEAVHAVACDELQLSVELLPNGTAVGLAVNRAVGTAFTVMATLTVGLVPPGPVQESEYSALSLSGPVLCVPLVGMAPPQAPAALHEVALVELQVKVAEPPASKVVDDAFKETVGAGTVRGPPPHADASRTDPAISREVKRTDIPGLCCRSIIRPCPSGAYEHYACRMRTSK
jgi:hypothetical protein